MKNYLLQLLFAVLAMATIVSCDDDDESGDASIYPDNYVVVEENITGAETWTKDNVYVLGGRIAVVSGATLEIEAGTIIKGEAGTGANATALIVAQGGVLNAEGTASEPIIFTSVADQIEPGAIASPNLTSETGLWGGLIVLGKARISVKGNGETAQIEGIPVTDSNGVYGGTADDDNSGHIHYISVRHGGANIGEGNEINGITLGGVGSSTEIDHVEVVATQDDGIEWFGGTVSVSDALILGNGDDAIDTDQAWAGTLDNFIIINPGDKAFELDGPEGDYPGAGHTITNGTVYLEGAAGGYDDDETTDAIVSNIFFTGITENTGKSNDYNVNGDFVATNFQFDTTAFEDEDENSITPVALDYFGDMNADIISEVTAGTVGADASEFTFTFASALGEF